YQPSAVAITAASRAGPVPNAMPMIATTTSSVSRSASGASRTWASTTSASGTTGAATASTQRASGPGPARDDEVEDGIGSDTASLVEASGVYTDARRGGAGHGAIDSEGSPRIRMPE